MTIRVFYLINDGTAYFQTITHEFTGGMIIAPVLSITVYWEIR